MLCTADEPATSPPPPSTSLSPTVASSPLPTTALARLAQGDLLAGRVRDAQAGFEALAARVGETGSLAVAALAGLVECRLAAGDLPQARAAAASLVVAAESAPAACGARAAFARGELAAAEGDTALAAEHHLRAGDLLGALDDDLDPALLPWRAAAALALVAERSGTATALAREHLDRARRAESPHGTAQALRVLALTDVAGHREALLREARAALTGVVALRLSAQVDADLAGLLLLTGPASTHAEALGLLRGVETYAVAEDLWPLRSRVRRLVERHAADHPAAAWSAPGRLDRLTGAERRVVAHAAEGLTNRQIAAEVGISVKSVEWHLSRVYRKLAITSRRQLGPLTGR